MAMTSVLAWPVRIDTRDGPIAGDLALPEEARALVVFAHGSGSSRHSPRNRAVADALNRDGFGTLLLDLLTIAEERIDQRTAEVRFDIGLLTARVVSAIGWTGTHAALAPLAIGLFGASTGAAAAIAAAAERPDAVRAVVSRGGRPDLAGDALGRIAAPTLLIVGGRDGQVLDLNREAMVRMRVPTRLEIVPGATHLFEEPGAIEEVARLASAWFARHLQVSPPRDIRGGTHA